MTTIFYRNEKAIDELKGAFNAFFTTMEKAQRELYNASPLKLQAKLAMCCHDPEQLNTLRHNYRETALKTLSIYLQYRVENNAARANQEKLIELICKLINEIENRESNPNSAPSVTRRLKRQAIHAIEIHKKVLKKETNLLDPSYGLIPRCHSILADQFCHLTADLDENMDQQFYTYLPAVVAYGRELSLLNFNDEQRTIEPIDMPSDWSLCPRTRSMMAIYKKAKAAHKAVLELLEEDRLTGIFKNYELSNSLDLLDALFKPGARRNIPAKIEAQNELRATQEDYTGLFVDEYTRLSYLTSKLVKQFKLAIEETNKLLCESSSFESTCSYVREKSLSLAVMMSNCLFIDVQLRQLSGTLNNHKRFYEALCHKAFPGTSKLYSDLTTYYKDHHMNPEEFLSPEELFEELEKNAQSDN